ncbi:tetratricopeptide repeat protein [Bdellovibrio bacteriovorus]|uniref:tetratricopeptide repeat protein n=1 Tax=Bdellovibrio bacteriovorus TaxID=959 RepID=UPI003A80443B
MKRIITCFSLLALAACSSSPTKDTPEETKTAVAEAPKVEVDEFKDLEKVEPVRPVTPPAPSQYAALNEAIKSQSDERIYQASTQILTQSPNDARALNALAMYHYKRGRFDLCRYLLGKAISSSPKTAELYSNLGIVQLAQNERRDAVKSFRKALDINNDEAVAAANLGAIYVQERDFAKAGVVLETAYRKGVRDPRVLNNYGIALTAQGKLDRAEEMYKAALKDSGNNKEVLFNYAILLVDHMQKYQDGLEVINRLKFVGGPADSRNRIIALENKAKAGIK